VPQWPPGTRPTLFFGDDSSLRDIARRMGVARATVPRYGARDRRTGVVASHRVRANHLSPDEVLCGAE